MSLAPASKDISAHPDKGSVVDPVNVAVKNADVERKIRLFGAIQAFRKSRMPTNNQIDETLKYVLDHSPIDVGQLSPDGKRLVQNTRDIIETARIMVKEKNADELLQNFVWNTRNINSDSLASNLSAKDSLPIPGGQDKSNNEQAVRHLRTLLSIVLTNSEVRKLLSDFSVIGRDLLSKGAIKAAHAIAPTLEELKTVDQTAPQNEFINEDDSKAGASDTPVLEATSSTVRRHPSDEPGVRAVDETDISSGQVQSQERTQSICAQDQSNTAFNAGDSQGNRQAQEHQAPNVEEAEGKKSGLMGRMRNVRDNVRDGISDRIPQQHKDKATDHLDRSKKFLSEEYFPEERRDQFIFRGKKVIIECQKHEDYQESIRWLLSYLEEYANHGIETAGSGTEGAKGIAADPHVRLTIGELRTLLERFANGRSLDIVLDAINVLIDDTRRDQSLKQWFSGVNSYIRKVLLEPGYVLEPDCNTHANKLRDTGRQYYDEKYKGHFDNMFNSISEWFGAMGEDALNRRFSEDWARLTKDLLFDSEGSLKYKPDLWNDIRKVIVPELIDQVGYIPIPRIEYSDEGLDLVVENLTLSGRNLFPNIVSVEAHNFLKFSPYSAIQDVSHHRVTLKLEQVQADMRDVAFYYRKKTGIPKMSDSGLADVLLSGEGLSGMIVLLSSDKDHSSVFKVHEVHVKVDTLKFAIRDSKHDFLYKTLRPLATMLIKRQVEKAIRDALTTGLEYVDGQLVAVRDRMESARVTEGESKTDVLKGLFSKNLKKDEGSMRSAPSTKQFKIVADKRNSILSKEGHPAGWVNRTAEKEEAAERGEGWRSDAFGIV